jgi:hypothetical protein
MSDEIKVTKLEIKTENWNKQFKYALKVANEPDGGKGETFKKHFGDLIEEGFFYFPINPETLRITTPFAVSVTPTANGVVQEHSGTVFFMISLRGNTGVLPGSSYDNLNLREKPGTRIRTSIHQTDEQINYYKNEHIKNINKGGYTAYHTLYNVLLRYSEIKKQGSKLQLQFMNFKDNMVYNVAVTNFDLTRDKSQPHLYNFSIEMKGWNLSDHLEYGSGPGQSSASANPVKSLEESKVSQLISIAKAKGFD